MHFDIAEYVLLTRYVSDKAIVHRLLTPITTSVTTASDIPGIIVYNFLIVLTRVIINLVS